MAVGQEKKREACVPPAIKKIARLKTKDTPDKRECLSIKKNDRLKANDTPDKRGCRFFLPY
jgi:hypothetical protein